MPSCEDVVREYVDHPTSKFSVESIPGGCKIVTAFRNLDNDAIIVYALETREGYRVTDMGYAFQFLFLHGIDAGGPTKRAWLVDSLANSYGVSIEEGEIVAKARKASDLPGAIERVIDALRSICHVTFALKPQPYFDFREEVVIFLQQNGNIIIPDREYRGRTEVHRIPIVIRFSQDVLIAPLSASSIAHARAIAERVAFQWVDLNQANVEFHSAAVVNDAVEDQPWNAQVMAILEGYSDAVVRWSERRNLLSFLEEWRR